MDPVPFELTARDVARADLLGSTDAPRTHPTAAGAWQSADLLRISLWGLTESEAALPAAIAAARAFVAVLRDHGASSAQVEAALEIAIADVFADLLVSQPGDEIAELDFAERAHQVMLCACPAPRGD